MSTTGGKLTKIWWISFFHDHRVCSLLIVDNFFCSPGRKVKQPLIWILIIFSIHNFIFSHFTFPIHPISIYASAYWQINHIYAHRDNTDNRTNASAGCTRIHKNNGLKKNKNVRTNWEKFAVKENVREFKKTSRFCRKFIGFEKKGASKLKKGLSNLQKIHRYF